jgi:mannosyltransferase OCH1-like enzyme
MIPKVIYQTWKTKILDNNIQNVINRIQNINPDYEIKLFDDDDIDIWIKNNFEDELIYNTYKKIKVGAGRADFWRYLILYINGGVYLDIDSDIKKPLNLLIKPEDQAIISREKNNSTNFFVQWCLMFSPKHPILLRAINLCIFNINNKTTTDLVKLTGPAVFTSAVNYVLKQRYNIETDINLFCLPDKYLNSIFNSNNTIKCRFYGKDYGDFCNYDNGCKDILLKEAVHWKQDKEIYNY